ncbi:hypothetical protein X801_00584 [Opisthorchis viverrini]|uniref:Uncharacterized protein n=2 Tax=Opisthorchis viverrini TaxID=6198 RepID=A0A075AI41_OPIVI|nr:hypothetical protein T265_02658 [Opisthorchis viverrini]KER30974.1 hypothetical protein T265_02658 [Opisthorchis viverrini]OON23500.1 hypothetical protein X801_00584 [Opisthorchis viverrini]
MDFERELTKLGLWRKLMPRDGKCLLNAIVDQLCGFSASAEYVDKLCESCCSRRVKTNAAYALDSIKTAKVRSFNSVIA